MSMISRSPSDTSVAFSLAELARIEAERVREEDTARTQRAERDARARREAETARRAAEAAELAAAAEAREKRLREEREENVRAEARMRAEMEVARITAEGKARLDAENAQRAHELAVLRTNNESGRRRIQILLAVVLGVAVAGGGAGAYVGEQRVAALTREAEQLREGQQALGREREQAKVTMLAALDRRFATLRARPNLGEAEEARRIAEAARGAVDPKALDHDRLLALGDALDALQGRLDVLERVASLDRRRDDLAGWAVAARRGEVMGAARTAGMRARLVGTSDAVRGYESALDQVRDGLGRAVPAGGRPAAVTSVDKGGKCQEGDPGCGLDGRPIF